MARYYYVMYSESYDWWTLALAFDAEPDKCGLLRQYEFSGVDDLGVYVSITGQRVIVTISCRIDMAMMAPDNYGYNYNCDDEEEETDDTDAGGAVVVTGDELLDLLAKIRKQIIGGDYRALYAVWEMYGDEEDDDPPPKPEEKKSGGGIVSTFESYLASY